LHSASNRVAFSNAEPEEERVERGGSGVRPAGGGGI